MNFKSLILICAVGMAFGQSAGTGKAQNYSSGDGSPVCLTKNQGGTVEIIPCAPFKPDAPKKPEPLDVPAIQEKQKNGLANCRGGDDDNLWHCVDSMHLVTTCADKERILEHSESGKYWCRKVQP